LEQLHDRFELKNIYTYVGDVLLVINPFQDFGIYSDYVREKVPLSGLTGVKGPVREVTFGCFSTSSSIAALQRRMQLRIFLGLLIRPTMPCFIRSGTKSLYLLEKVVPGKRRLESISSSNLSILERCEPTQLTLEQPWM